MPRLWDLRLTPIPGVDILVCWTLLSRLHRHIEVFYFNKNPSASQLYLHLRGVGFEYIPITMQLLLLECSDRRIQPHSREIMLA